MVGQIYSVESGMRLLLGTKKTKRGMTIEAIQISMRRLQPVSILFSIAVIEKDSLLLSSARVAILLSIDNSVTTG